MADSSGAEPTTVWRQMLGESWEELRRNRDWKGIPQVHDYVARLMTGRTIAAGGDWLQHSLRNHLLPLSEALGRPLSMVAFGCGPALIEAATLRAGWPIARLLCCEYDAALLDAARDTLAPFPLHKEFRQFDFNAPRPLPEPSYDLVFFCHSLHHCADVETFFPFLNGLLGEHGIILGLDYLGPPRLQIEHETSILLQEIYACLPAHLRLDLETQTIATRCRAPTIAQVRSYDPTEAPRSADIRALLFSAFEVIEKLPMGGTLLRHLLAQHAGNYRTESDFAILDLLFMIEREMIASRRIQSDDMYFVLKRSRRLDPDAAAG